MDDVHEADKIDHSHIGVERIETISSSTMPWGLRLAFGLGGILLLLGAFAAWEFRGAMGDSISQALPWLIAAAVLLGAGAIIESITVAVWVALILGVFAVAITFLIAGRVTTYPSQGQAIFVIDRFTGEVEFCTPDHCRVLPSNTAFLPAPPSLPVLPGTHAK